MENPIKLAFQLNKSQELSRERGFPKKDEWETIAQCDVIISMLHSFFDRGLSPAEVTGILNKRLRLLITQQRDGLNYGDSEKLAEAVRLILTGAGD